MTIEFVGARGVSVAPRFSPVLTTIPILGDALSDNNVLILDVGVFNGRAVVLNEDLSLELRILESDIKPDGGVCGYGNRRERRSSHVFGKGVGGQILTGRHINR